MRSLKLSTLVFVVLLVYGCVSAPVVEESGEREVASASTDQTREVDRPSAPVARQIDEIAAESDAVAYLLDRAEQAETDQNYDLAQSLAERALRIQRTSARAYLVLAQVHSDQGDSGKAVEFARQGLLYTSESSNLGRRLLELL